MRSNTLRNRLTPRQFELAGLAAQGWSGTEIARRLCITHKTVGTMLGMIYKRLGFDNTEEINCRALLSFMYLYENGFDMEESMSA